MKKPFKKALFSMFFAFATLFSLAQVPVLIPSQPIDTNLVTTTTATIKAYEQFPGTYFWHVQAQPQKVGTTVWRERNTNTYVGPNQYVTEMVDSLDPNSTYRLRLIVYDSARVFTDTVYYTSTIHTKPQAEPVHLISIDTVSQLPNSGYSITASVVGQASRIYAVDAGNPAIMVTNVVQNGFSSNFTDTVLLLSDGPCMQHSAVYIIIEALDGSSYDISGIIPAFSSPCNAPPVLVSDTPVTTPQTFHVRLTPTSLGNGGNPTLVVTIKDTLGNPVYQKTQLVTSTNPINIDTVLASNRGHHLNAFLTNPLGLADTISFSFMMPNVAGPSAVGSLLSGFGFTDFTAAGYINRNGTGDSSAIKVAYLQRNGLSIDSVVAPTSDTVVFHETNQPLNTNYQATIRVINNANLSITSNAFNVRTKPTTAVTMNNGVFVKTAHSIHLPVSVTNLGNGGNPTAVIIVKDTTGSLVYYSDRLVTTTGIMNVDTNNLVSNRWHHLWVFLTNPLGVADTISFSFKTLNVDSASLTLTQQLPLTFFTSTIKAFIDPKGSDDSSQVVRVELIDSSNTVIAQQTPMLTDTGTITFTQTGQTPGVTKTFKVRVINGAGLSTTRSINVSTLGIIPPDITNNTPVNAPKLVFMGVNVVNVGNGGSDSLRVSIIDTLDGSVVFDTLVLGITTTGLRNFSTTNVRSNHAYFISAVITNTLHASDSIWVVTKTPNVSLPSATATVTTTFTDYAISAPITKNGTYDSSAIKKVRFFENNIAIDSVIGDITLANFHIYQRTPGVTYYGKIEVTNLANLVYTTSTFNIVMNNVSPNGAPTFYALFAEDASTLRITNIAYHATGSASKIRLLRKDLTTGVIDTITMLSGVTGNGSIPFFILDDCYGNHTYEIMVFDENQYGAIVWGYYDQQNMPAPELNPILASVSQITVANSDNMIGVKALGSRGGNQCTMTFHLYKANIEQGNPFQVSSLPGEFDYEHIWDNLNPGTQYKVIVELESTNGGAANPITKFFTTTGVATDIDELPLSVNTIPRDKIVRMWNLQGQEIAYGEFQNALSSAKARGNHIVLIELYDLKGVVERRGKLPLF